MDLDSSVWWLQTPPKFSYQRWQIFVKEQFRKISNSQESIGRNTKNSSEENPGALLHGLGIHLLFLGHQRFFTRVFFSAPFSDTKSAPNLWAKTFFQGRFVWNPEMLGVFLPPKCFTSLEATKIPSEAWIFQIQKIWEGGSYAPFVASKKKNISQLEHLWEKPLDMFFSINVLWRFEPSVNFMSSA